MAIEETDIEKLEKVIDELPDKNDFTGTERREYSLTKGDVLLIYKIAKIASLPHVCPFEDEEKDTLNSVAKNINRTQKIASGVIITGLVTGVLWGIWHTIVYMAKQFASGKIGS